MKKNIKILLAFTLFLLITGLVMVGRTDAQSPLFTLTKNVLGSAGLVGSADDFTFHTTLGQPVAGMQTEGEYEVTSGFWLKIQEILEEFRILLPIIFK